MPLLTQEFTVHTYDRRGRGESTNTPAEMRGTPQWAKMESVAPTLVYDCMISDTIKPMLLRFVVVPTLVLHSEGSTDDLTSWAARVAGQLPHATHRSLAGKWHAVPDDILAPVLIEFFRT